MSDKLTLYYSPGACSLAPHIALREAGADFALAKFSSRHGETESPQYRAINPRGLVPALARKGAILTECTAILLTIAEDFPKSGLLPEDPVERARAVEWTCWCSTNIHQAFRQIFRSYHSVGADADASVKKAVEDYGTELIARHFTDADERLARRDWAAGADFSIADAHLFVFSIWAKRLNYPLAERHPHYAALCRRMAERPAVRTALEVEGLIEPMAA